MAETTIWLKNPPTLHFSVFCFQETRLSCNLKKSKFSFLHWLFFHPFSVQLLYPMIFRGFFFLLSHLMLTSESLKHNKAHNPRDEPVLFLHRQQTGKEPILNCILMHFVTSSLLHKHITCSQMNLWRIPKTMAGINLYCCTNKVILKQLFSWKPGISQHDVQCVL